MQVQRKTESKLLERTYVEFVMDSKGGSLSRNEAIAAAASELGALVENLGLIRLEGQSGTKTVLGKFYLYASKDSKGRMHPRHLGLRTLSKEEREKLKQEKKKAATPAPAPEAKK